jgi:hypothetical protein
VCDATGADSSNAGDYIENFFIASTIYKIQEILFANMFHCADQAEK